MKNISFARVFISVVLFTVFLAIPVGNAYAMPFNVAINYTVGTNPFFVAVGDFNEDGKLDLATANYSDATISILLGNGLGGFGPKSDIAVGSSPYCVAVGDFDLDDHLDLVVANQGSNDVSILLGDGLGGFGVATNYGVGTWPQSVAVGDFNGDSKPDLAVANAGGGAGVAGSVTIWVGDGAGGFLTRTDWAMGHNCYSVAVRDFNGDGKLDLVTANRDSVVCVRLGDGSGGFGLTAEYNTADLSTFVAVGDFDLNGIPDLAVANTVSAGPPTPGTVSILLGNGDGTFKIKTDYSTLGVDCNSVVVDDFNGDGKPDLAVANNGSTNVSVLLGNGLGAFAEATGSPWSAGSGPRFAATGDFNLDGAPDLAVANGGSNTVSRLLNTPEPPTLTSFLPASGGTGTSVVITGTNFTRVTAVVFGGTAATFTFNSATQITAVVGAGTTGKITVTTPGGEVTSADTFTWIPAPTITSFLPTSGGAGTSVVITGANFTGATAVTIGGTPAVITSNTGTQITATVGAGTTGTITVITPGGTGTSAATFTLVASPTPTPPTPSIGTGAPASHGSSVSAPATPAPPVSLPSLVIQSASLSAKAVTPGTPITVTADIANKSAVNGNKKVTLYVNGQVETTQGITVNSGGSTKLTFNVSRSEPGDYIVYVDDVPAGSFKVELFSESDGILIFSAVLVALAFLIGMIMLWHRQRAV